MRLVLCSLLLVACSNTVEVERSVTPADARAAQKLTPVSIVRGEENIAIPVGAVVEETHIVVSGAANVMELDERGKIVSVKNAAGEWTDPGETISLRKNDKILVRGTLAVGDPVPGGGRVVMKRQSGALAFGIVAFGLAYLPALIAGAASNDDRPLMAPFGGPWANLVTRPACVVDPMVGANCIPDTMARFGSVMSGIFQALGLVFVIAGTPAHAAVEEPELEEEKKDKDRDNDRDRDRDKASLQFVPLPNGGGLVGRF